MSRGGEERGGIGEEARGWGRRPRCARTCVDSDEQTFDGGFEAVRMNVRGNWESARERCDEIVGRRKEERGGSGEGNKERCLRSTREPEHTSGPPQALYLYQQLPG
eukprot:451390-Hanusia_phi.AAC.2